jgi:hypothetical protein
MTLVAVRGRSEYDPLSPYLECEFPDEVTASVVCDRSILVRLPFGTLLLSLLLQTVVSDVADAASEAVVVSIVWLCLLV